jgi:hypothetical protein
VLAEVYSSQKKIKIGEAKAKGAEEEKEGEAVSTPKPVFCFPQNLVRSTHNLRQKRAHFFFFLLKSRVG